MVRINTGAYKLTIGRDTPPTLAGVLLSNFHYAKDEGGRIYCYDESSGVYKGNGEKAIKQHYGRLLVEQDGGMAQWKSRVEEEIIKFIVAQGNLPSIWEQPPTNRINLANGVWDIDNERIMPHTHEYLSTVQIPVKYDPIARCDRWEMFLDDLIPTNGGKRFLYEIIALCLTSVTSLQVAIILLGSGSNGKSTFLKALERLLGEENVSKVDLRTLCNPNDRFTTYVLKNKLLNYVDDASQAKLIDTAAIKSLITGDRIRVEQKGKDAHFIKPFCKFIFSTNDIIQSEDHTAGYKRRWYYVPFVQRFAVAKAKGDELDEDLASPKEQSGVLNKVLPLLPNLLTEGFTFSDELAQVVDSYVPISPRLETWFRNSVELNPKAVLPFNPFYLHILEDATRFHDRPWTRQDIYSIMKRMFGAEVVRVRIHGVQTKCFRGVLMADKELQKRYESYNRVDEE